MTEEQMLAEIKRLRASPNAKAAAKAEQKKASPLARKLYQYRYLEKKGKALLDAEKAKNKE